MWTHIKCRNTAGGVVANSWLDLAKCKCVVGLQYTHTHTHTHGALWRRRNSKAFSGAQFPVGDRTQMFSCTVMMALNDAGRTMERRSYDVGTRSSIRTRAGDKYRAPRRERLDWDDAANAIEVGGAGPGWHATHLPLNQAAATRLTM